MQILTAMNCNSAKKLLVIYRSIIYNTTMKKAVIDTNVFISALKSRKGASYKLLFMADREKFIQVLSTPLVFEYEELAKRKDTGLQLNDHEIDTIIDALCALSEHCQLYFLWRPFLKDTRDDLVLELAVESQSDYIVTYNLKDFQHIGNFHIKAVTPQGFFQIIGE
jgi:putative PIN family toxin of toxin-antitoxin system